jgi:hypothetical protein
MKYFDVIYFLGNGLDTLIIFLLPGEQNYVSIFVTSIAISVLSLVFIPFFPKVKKNEKNEEDGVNQGNDKE